MDEVNVKIAKDTVAKIVMERTERARKQLESRIVHQGVSFATMLTRADEQYTRVYDAETAARMKTAFGFCPTRFYGVTQQKVNAARAWKRDLVVNSLSTVITCVPSPEPELDKLSRDNIRAGIQRDLKERILAKTGGNNDILVGADGKTEPAVLEYMRRQATMLKDVEQIRMVSVASAAAKRADVKMRDYILQGGFRNAYGKMTHNQFLYGIGFGRFPHWEMKSVLNHSGKTVKRENEMRATFRSVNPRNMFCIDDADNMQDNTGNTEVSSVTKGQLVQMTSDKRYNRKEIEAILKDFTNVDRNWLGIAHKHAPDAAYWGPDESIPILIHEGYVNGQDLSKMNVTGVGPLDSVNIHAIVCGGRTILCEAKKSPDGLDRTFFGVPFNKFGDGIHDVVGIAAAVRDIEQQVNVTMHIFENNLDWASRPPVMVNSTTFENPLNAKNINPGQQYEIADSYTSGSSPDPLRPMRTVSAQYHLIHTQIDALLRKADEASGIPSFAYGSGDYGKASLGEYSQRMSNALRVVKEAAIDEDLALEPAWRALFNHLMRTDKTFSEGQDVDLVLRGITGLMTKDLADKERRNMIGIVQAGVDRGAIPKEVEDFAFRQVLVDAGFPIESLGMDDPILDSAAAQAAGAPNSFVAGSPQVPAVDGRSTKGMAQGAVATPNGQSTY